MFTPLVHPVFVAAGLTLTAWCEPEDPITTILAAGVDDIFAGHAVAVACEGVRVDVTDTALLEPGA